MQPMEAITHWQRQPKQAHRKALAARPLQVAQLQAGCAEQAAAHLIPPHAHALRTDPDQAT